MLRPTIHTPTMISMLSFMIIPSYEINHVEYGGRHIHPFSPMNSTQPTFYNIYLEIKRGRKGNYMKEKA
jgi:hypothetical protein